MCVEKWHIRGAIYTLFARVITWKSTSHFDLTLFGMTTTRVYEVLSCTSLEAAMFVKEPTHSRFLRHAEGSDAYKLLASWAVGATLEPFTLIAPATDTTCDVRTTKNGYLYNASTKEYILVHVDVRDEMYKYLNLGAYLPSTLPRKLLESANLCSADVYITNEDLQMFSDDEKKTLVAHGVLSEPFDVLSATLD